MNKIYFLIIFLIFLTPVYANQLPVAAFTSSRSYGITSEEGFYGVIDEPNTFNASNSYDPDGSIVKYEWDFGDGTSATGKIVSHSYSRSSDGYKVTLTVTDNNGAKNSTMNYVAIMPIKIISITPKDKFYSFGWDLIGNVTVYYDKGNPWSEAGYDLMGWKIKVPEIGYEETFFALTAFSSCDKQPYEYCSDVGNGVIQTIPLWIYTRNRMSVNPTSIIIEFWWRGIWDWKDMILYNTTYTGSIEESVPEGVAPFEITSIQHPSVMYMALDKSMNRYYSYASIPIDIHINAKNYHYLCTSGDVYGTCWGTFGPNSNVRIDDSYSPNYFSYMPDDYPTSATPTAVVSSGSGSGNVIYSTSKNFSVNYKPGSIIYIYSFYKQSEFTSFCGNIGAFGGCYGATDSRAIGGIQINVDEPDGSTYKGGTHTAALGPPGTYRIRVPSSVDKYFRYGDWSNMPLIDDKIYFSRWNDNDKLNEKTVTLEKYDSVSYNIFYVKDFNDTCFKDLGKNCEYCGCPTDYSCDAPAYLDRCHKVSRNCTVCGCFNGAPPPAHGEGGFDWFCNETTGKCDILHSVYGGYWQVIQRFSPSCTLYENASTCSSNDERLIDYTCTDTACSSSLFDCNSLDKSCSSGSCQEPLYCSDGTRYSQCSITKPKYCNSGTLINKCSQCGCPSNQLCNTTSEECYTETSLTCVDSDNGQNTYVKGTCTDSFGSYEDSCQPGGWLKEYYCNNSLCVNNSWGCAYNFICSDEKCVKNLVPKIVESAERVNIGENIHFDASQSYILNGSIAKYSWYFNDGTSASGVTVDHSFSSLGVYKVYLTCEDNRGRTITTDALKFVGPTSSTCSKCAYIANDPTGLLILDISDYYNPKFVSNYIIPQHLPEDFGDPLLSSALGVKVLGKYAYLVDDQGGFSILDISTPNNIKLVGNYTIPDELLWNTLSNVFVSEHYAYISSYLSGLKIIDISNPSNPRLVGNYNTNTNDFVSDFYISGQYAYLGFYDKHGEDLYNLSIIDISNPSNPRLVSNYNFLNYISNIYVSNQYAYVTDGEGNLSIIDISNPSNPRLFNSYVTNANRDIFFSNQYAYIGTDNSIQILDISDPSNPSLKGKYTINDYSGFYFNIYVSNQYAYIGTDNSIQILDISDSSNIRFISKYNLPDVVWNIFVPVSANEVTVSFQPGWNMFSLPTTTTAASIKTQCGTTNNIWHYNPLTAKYESATTIESGKGYWIKLSSSCSITSSIGTQIYPELKAGWNQIGALSSISFNSVKGDCNVLGGPWKYNPSAARYESSSTLEPGYGYWVKVSNDCSLGKFYIK